MTKRARGTVRPGQRRPLDRRASSTAPDSSSGGIVAPRPSSLTESEAARAAELEAKILEEERAAEQARARARTPRVEREAPVPGGLTARAAQEYAYVARDLRDIVRIGALLFATLFGLWILIDVAKVFG